MSFINFNWYKKTLYTIRKLLGTKADLVDGKVPVEQLFCPNWNENDETSTSYIQNRTHYSVIKDKILLDGTRVTISESGDSVYNPFDIKLSIGKTYIVKFNGVEYTCVAKNAYEYGQEPFIGNQFINNQYDGVDTGEPFYISVYISGDYSESYFTATIAGTHVISIIEREEDVYHLDQKFLPETTKYQGDWNEYDESSSSFIKNRPFYIDKTERLLVENASFETKEDFTTVLAPFTLENGLEENKTYLVIFDDEKYECIPYGAGASGAGPYPTIGNCDIVGLYGYTNGEPFICIISDDGVLNVGATEAGVHIISISIIDEEIVPIPETYIPDTIARVVDIPVVDNKLNSYSTNPVQNKVINSKLSSLSKNVNSIKSEAVLHTEQSLTDEQKSQARTNIGAVTSWNELSERPFYEGRANTAVIVVTASGALTTPYEFANDYMIDIYASKYYALYDGVEYELVPLMGSTDTTVTAGLGNASMANSDWKVVDSPFYIEVTSDYSWNTIGNTTVYFTDDDTHTLEIYEFVPHTIDEKFIPDSISREGHTHSWNDLTDKPFGEEKKDTIFVKEQTVTTVYDNSFGMPAVQLTSDSTFPSDDIKNICVVFDGVRYDGLSVTEGGYVQYIGDAEFVTMPFMLGAPDGINVYLMTSNEGEHTIEMYAGSVTPIDEKYLPESVKGGGEPVVFTWNDSESVMYNASGEAVSYEEAHAAGWNILIMFDDYACRPLSILDNGESSVFYTIATSGSTRHVNAGAAPF